jgi:hypothetical protein
MPGIAFPPRGSSQADSSICPVGLAKTSHSLGLNCCATQSWQSEELIENNEITVKTNKKEINLVPSQFN